MLWNNCNSRVLSKSYDDRKGDQSRIIYSREDICRQTRYEISQITIRLHVIRGWSLSMTVKVQQGYHPLISINSPVKSEPDWRVTSDRMYQTEMHGKYLVVFTTNSWKFVPIRTRGHHHSHTVFVGVTFSPFVFKCTTKKFFTHAAMILKSMKRGKHSRKIGFDVPE